MVTIIILETLKRNNHLWRQLLKTFYKNGEILD